MLSKEVLALYDVLDERHLEGIKSEGTLLKHKKSGARVVLISNDDENKVFCIGFRTPPVGDTGVPHIIEHTVLNGSEKYPVKDPFTELAKGSLQTFLNAMTYPDKTIYPVASCNDQDFKNLMGVYMDSVLCPNIYKEEKIFRQEGWRYELESKDAELKYNGVVYNEMKGAYSSSEEVMMMTVNKAMFPDTPYSRDSGGNPKYIPTLTYESYLDFHRTYYHPCNSYICLAGNMDMNERLLFMDRDYLSKYDIIDVNSEIDFQKPFNELKEVTETYSITEDEDEKGKTEYSLNLIVSDSTMPEKVVAFDVIAHCLLNMPGAPLKQALLDAGVGNDIGGGISNYTRQHLFTISAKNAEAGQLSDFKRIIREVLTETVEKGISKKNLEASLNKMEFRYREADFGGMAKGLYYAIDSLNTWLYDEMDPWSSIELLDVYKSLREKINTSYYEDLIKECLLDNTFGAYVTLSPEKGKATREEEELKKLLADKKASMTDEEIDALVAWTAELKKYQEEPSSKEDLATIPQLQVSDIEKKAQDFNNEVNEVAGVKTVFHDYETNGIHYLRLHFDLPMRDEKTISYLGLFKDIFGLVDTEKYSYEELSAEIDRTTGGIGAGISIFEKLDEADNYDLTFIVSLKNIYGKMDVATKLVNEIIKSSRYDSEKRLKELISETRSRLDEDMGWSGNAYGALRAGSYFNERAAVRDLYEGIGYLDFLVDLDEHFEDRKAEIIENLTFLSKYIFREEYLTVSSTCRREEFSEIEPLVKLVKDGLCHEVLERELETSLKLSEKTEGIMTASQVQYVCLAGNYKNAGFKYHGAMNLLRVIMSTEYLYKNIRVKGGAYGCGLKIDKTGDAAFTSYRDPNLTKTLSVYEGVKEYLENFEADDLEMTKFIVGTIGGLDRPLSPSQKGARAMGLLKRNISYESLQEERDQVINASVEDIRSFAAPLDAVVKQNHLCVIGNDNKIKEAKDIFKTLRGLNR